MTSGSFVDYAKIHLKAGDGGDGCISFRREKYVPRGGPDGGDGGRGGDIYLIGDARMTTLLDFRYRPHYTTKRGGHGGSNNKSGRDAEDLRIHVPLGTAVSTPEGELLADITQPGQELIAAKGGRGGRGNQHFATATNKAPRRWEYGGDGEERTIILELKVIADVGIIGLPNAGKSTLLAALTAATPKIASYPFTTVHPNLGVMEFGYDERCTIADIPGLIEGAHRGAGLGDRFLRHIERTRVLVHLIAPAEGEEVRAEPEYVRYAHQLVRDEMREYSPLLPRKPEIVCTTKIDMLGEAQVATLVQAFREAGIDALAISAKTGAGLGALRERIRSVLAETSSPEINTDEHG